MDIKVDNVNFNDELLSNSQLNFYPSIYIYLYITLYPRSMYNLVVLYLLLFIRLLYKAPI